MELGSRHLTEKLGRPIRAVPMDYSAQNDGKEDRAMKFSYDDAGKRSEPVPLHFAFTEEAGWHIAP